MLVGKIRDFETAKLAIRCALTGHLVFNTLHTNDAPGAMPRLLDIGIEASLTIGITIYIIYSMDALLLDRHRPTEEMKQQGDHAVDKQKNQRSIVLAFVLAILMAFSYASGEDSPVAPPAGSQSPDAVSTSSPSIEIEVGTLGGNKGFAEWVTREISLFEKTGKGIAVKKLAMDGIERNLHPIETLPQLADNVFIMRSEMGYEPTYLAKKGLIVPINQFLPDPGFLTTDFYDALWEPVAFEGQFFGVPVASRPDVLVFNRDMFRAEGIESPPRTWDDFASFAKRLTKDRNGDGQVDQWGVRIDSSEYVLGFGVISMVLQKGGHIIKDARFTMEDPCCAEAYNFWKDFVNASGACRVDGRDFSEAVRDKQYAMEIVHTRNVQWTQGRDDLQLAYLPTWGKNVSVSETNLYWGIRRSTPQAEKASWEFVKWMSRRDVGLPVQNIFRGWPCRKDFVDREDFMAVAKRGPIAFDVLFRAQAYTADFSEQRIMNRLQAVERFTTALKHGILANQDFASVSQSAVHEANALCKPLSFEDADAIYK